MRKKEKRKPETDSYESSYANLKPENSSPPTGQQLYMAHMQNIYVQCPNVQYIPMMREGHSGVTPVAFQDPLKQENNRKNDSPEKNNVSIGKLLKN